MKYFGLSKRLIRRGYELNIERYPPSRKELEEWRKFSRKHDLRGFEGWFLPEHWYYDVVLDNIEPDDVVLDACAGNLALSILLAAKAKRVYAVEVNPNVVADALNIIGYQLPRNLIVIVGNVLDIPLPRDVNTIVLLNIHFQHDFPEEWSRVDKIITSKGGELKIIKRA